MMAVNQDFQVEQHLQQIVSDTIKSIIAIPEAFNLDYNSLKKSKIAGTPKFHTLVASEIQNFFQNHKQVLIESTQQNITSLNLLQQFRDFFGRVLYSKFYVSIIISFDDLKTLGFALNLYISSLRDLFCDNDQTAKTVKLTENYFEQMQSQVKEIGQVLFSEIKTYRQVLGLQALYDVLQHEQAEMETVTESIKVTKFIPGLNNELTQIALAFGVHKNIIKKELQSLSLSYLKYINSGILFQEQKYSYYKDFKERQKPQSIQEMYSHDQKCNQVLGVNYPLIHRLWMCFFRKESCVTYRRLRKALYLDFYSREGFKISNSTLRLEHYLPPIGFFSLNSSDQNWKFQCIEQFMKDFIQDLHSVPDKSQNEEIKESVAQNCHLLPDAEVKFELRLLFEKNGSLSQKKVKQYSQIVTMNDHIYIGNSNPWYQNDIELLTRKDFLDPNCTQLILLKGEPKGFPQVIDLSGIQTPQEQSQEDQNKQKNELRLNSMNFFSYHKAQKPSYRIRQGTIILIDTLSKRKYKVIQNLPVDLKQFYMWEKQQQYQIVDPWMEFLYPKEKFSDLSEEFMLKDMIGQYKVIGQIDFGEKSKSVALNQEIVPEENPQKQVFEFRRLQGCVVLNVKNQLSRKGVNVGILMKKHQEFKDQVPSVPVKLTQPNITIQFQKAGLAIKFIKF